MNLWLNLTNEKVLYRIKLILIKVMLHKRYQDCFELRMYSF